MKRMMKAAALSVLAVVLVMGLASCGDLFAGASDGVSVTFAITDAPIDESLVTEVNITVETVSVNTSADAQIDDTDGSWTVMTLATPVTLNLLDLQGGLSEALGEGLVIDGGTQINQIRLGIADDSVTVVDNTGSHVATIPSANRSGLKIVNAFDVPLTGELGITIDFDVRKSVGRTGNSGDYFIRPVLRAVVDNEAGQITGTVPSGTTTVYAYANDTFATSESTENADGLTYAGAYTSAAPTVALAYTLAFLEAGTYDLYGVDSTGTVVASKADVVVTEGDTIASQTLTAIAD